MRRQLQGIALILVSILLTQCFGGEWFWGREFRWCVVFGLTDERIDKLLSGGYYGSTNPEYAQAYMAYMSLEDFLKLATGKNQRALERIKKWDYSEEEFDMDKMADKWNYQPIQLNIDEETLEVIGHE